MKKILDDSKNGDIVSVKAKVVSKSPVDTVYSHHIRRELKKCELIIVDSTPAIPLTVWENMIDKVENDETEYDSPTKKPNRLVIQLSGNYG